MARTLIQKILYKRRKFVTKKRLIAAAEIAATLLPTVVSKRPGLAVFAEIFNTILGQTQTTSLDSSGLRQQIKDLRAQLALAQGSAEEGELRKKLDILYGLLVEDAEAA